MLPCRAFCLVILGFSCILVGDWGAEIAFDAADVSEFGGLLGAWAVTAVLLTLGPLVLVSPRLLEAPRVTRVRRASDLLHAPFRRTVDSSGPRQAPARYSGSAVPRGPRELLSGRPGDAGDPRAKKGRPAGLAGLGRSGAPASAHEISSGGAARTALSDRREVGARVRLLTWKRSRPGGVLSFS